MKVNVNIKKQVLLENLINRIETVDDSYNFHLPGNITREEYEALKTASIVFQGWNFTNTASQSGRAIKNADHGKMSWKEALDESKIRR